jgi:cell division protein FtsB
VALGENNKVKNTRRAIANERLEVALLRLEKAMGKNAEHENPADLEKTAALVSENDKLRNTNKAIEDRLNGAVKNLRNILKEA